MEIKSSSNLLFFLDLVGPILLLFLFLVRGTFSSRRGRAIQVAQITIPAETDHVDEQDAMLEGDELEIDHLDKRPDEVIRRETFPVGPGEFLPGTAAF